MKTMRKYRGTTTLDSLCVWLFLMTIVFWGCAEKRHVVRKGPEDREIIERMLRDAYDDWKDTPHRMGGCSKRGVDCSCFVWKIYEDVFHYDVKTLPRTVKGLATMKKGNASTKMIFSQVIWSFLSNRRPGINTMLASIWVETSLCMPLQAKES